MPDRPFMDQSAKPTGQSLQAALGNTYSCYEKVLALTGLYSQEWNFAKSSGWMLKIFDRKKALLYLIPLNNGFKISLTIREPERDAFLRDDELASLHSQISTSKKVPEGFALQFKLTAKNELQVLELFLGKLMVMRAHPAAS